MKFARLFGKDLAKALALWLGLAALIVQALAPLCAAGLMGGTAGGTAIVLCTAHGFQTVTVDADGKPVPNTPSQDQTCPLCVAMHAAGAFIPAALLFLFVPLFVPQRASAAIRVRVRNRHHVSYVTRGPPGFPLKALA